MAMSNGVQKPPNMMEPSSFKGVSGFISAAAYISNIEERERGRANDTRERVRTLF
jgi:hypothetical protein